MFFILEYGHRQNHRLHFSKIRLGIVNDVNARVQRLPFKCVNSNLVSVDAQ